MRLYLIPISTRRTLLYCQKLDVAASEKQTLADKIQSKAARTWASWEQKEKGWQKSVVNYGNYAFRRIPYEEWGLKSVPPLSQRRKETEVNGTEKVEVVYPKTLLSMDRVPRVLETLATERESLHRKRMIYCLIGMPISAPVALIPVIPNIPFFYLVYRAWSHWRALLGGKHVQFLVNKNLLSLTPSAIIDQVYATQKYPLPSTPQPTTGYNAYQVKNLDPSPETSKWNSDGETMLLSQAAGKAMTQALELPQLEVEVERAIWQVETAIQKQNAGLAQDGAGKTTDAKQKSDGEATSSQEKEKDDGKGPQ
ncbi:mitochondrial K+-H+ exchange-related-domain-containing protein [Podospora appendiculata]|uniref:Mitochondrial K+-H+ exchange-related-domain-containing protein n=1 Tax=Podospora appendiculata TaxID=314037 RepID=A0AAE0X7H8_9PEZI|nr:mitochondrial K+-H+ exchange-related-domain-containing protein [Podospora appendiculata]